MSCTVYGWLKLIIRAAVITACRARKLTQKCIVYPPFFLPLQHWSSSSSFPPPLPREISCRNGAMSVVGMGGWICRSGRTFWKNNVLLLLQLELHLGVAVLRNGRQTPTDRHAYRHRCVSLSLSLSYIYVNMYVYIFTYIYIYIYIKYAYIYDSV